MRKLDDWSVTDTGCQETDVLANGNRMLIGNGYLGYRGTTEEADASDMPATIVSGLYDRYGDKWREPVNAPNALLVRLYAGGGELLSLRSKHLVSHEQRLDFRYGLWSRITSWKVDGVTVTVRSERFASMAARHCLAMRYSVDTDGPLTLRMERGIDCAVRDLNGPHLGHFAFSASGPDLAVECKTLELGIPLRVRSSARFDFPAGETAAKAPHKPDSFFCGEYRLDCKPGLAYSLAVFAEVSAGSDPDAETFASSSAAGTAAVNATAGGSAPFAPFAAGSGPNPGMSGEFRYREALAAHKAAWDAIWADGDVLIEGDDEAARSLRYSLYQLQIIAPRHARDLSIPARGLSGQTYKGAIFWDTEMFMAPYFLVTDPDVAKSFIRYRVKTLDGARRKALEYGFRGAFYAWESQESGDDACSDFNVTDVFTGRPQRTWFRDKQFHISADVVYAIREYVETTGDWTILDEGAFEVIVECARFFMSCAFYSPTRRRYEILDVIGPDEYHERVNNNAFTNRMVKLVFDTLLEFAEALSARGSPLPGEVFTNTGFAAELPLLREMAEKLYVPAPGPDGVIEQFDGYFKLEDASLSDVKGRLLDPKEYWGGGNGVASNTQVIKQADVVLMLNLFSGEYPDSVKRANLAFYEPRTEHGSSLSACMYSLLSCETGDSAWSYPFFRKTAEVDITGESKQFAGLVYIGGTHPAANGGAWLSAIRGFCGFSIKDGEVTVNPRLPEKWKRVTFTARVRGVKRTITVTKDGFTQC